MDGNPGSSDEVIAKLIDMGFEVSQVMEAIETVGPSLNNAIDHILNNSYRNNKGVSTVSNSSTKADNGQLPKPLGKRSFSLLHPFSKTRQSRIMDHLQPAGKSKKCCIPNTSSVTNSKFELETENSGGQAEMENSHIEESSKPNYAHESSELLNGIVSPHTAEIYMESGPSWSQKANALLQKHFGYQALKSFQKEALSAWAAHQDCLVLAATGSGKSLCFQLPALLTGKVVVMISPLISLMHDQCLKLVKYGISACFLGSGQPDSSVEKKAMNGMYSIIYVCPETVLRLIASLQRLAENRGITLFAIDEVHCVSKWGHDFRPDYRRLSMLRENFSAKSLKSVEFDIPIMALTATATIDVREDILKSLRMAKEAKVVLTTFYRPNLHFLVKHSRTTSPTSYVNDFKELVQVYSQKQTPSSHNSITVDLETESEHSTSNTDDEMEEDDSVEFNNEPNMLEKIGFPASKERQLSVEYLEDDFDDIRAADDFDVSYGEFCELPLTVDCKLGESTELQCPLNPAESSQSVQGPTIIYVPTRKETLRIAKFLCSKGIKAAAYNAALAKSHLRQVHKEFHENLINVVVATIAFGMGIDKQNVRKIIHYGWPQSLEAYYQEAGRAGRDGKSADCILYANLTKIPTLLPSKRSEEQKTHAYKMLSDCFRYGVNTSWCRAKILVEYFGENFSDERCMSCDVCRNGPPELQNLKEEANIFMQVVAAHYKQLSFGENAYDDLIGHDFRRNRANGRLSLRMFITKIREHSQKFLASDQQWWQGLARILEDKGFIREGREASGVQVRFPEPTALGLRFLESAAKQDFFAYPEADMLLSSTRTEKPFSSFSEWGRGWADPEIRKQRLSRMKSKKKKPRNTHKRKSSSQYSDMKTVRGRLTAKLSKQKR